MNIETIAAPVRVLAAFAGGTCEPMRFVWKARTYKIDLINGRWIDRHGDGYCLHYSVQCGGNTFYLHFASKEVQWWLDQMIAE